MLRFNLKFDKYEYDPRLAENAFDAWLRHEIREAARVFFFTALPLIHVDTGMSIASMKNLAMFLDEPLDYSSRIKSPPDEGGYRPPDTEIELDKSPYNGELMGTPLNKIIRKTETGKYIFSYWTEVWHFVLWDTVGLPRGRNGPTGMPWEAFLTAQQAALEYMDGAADRMPALDMIFSVAQVNVQIQEGITRTDWRRRGSSESRNLFEALPED